MGKKSWLSMHSRNFVSDKIVCTYLRPPLRVSGCDSLARNPRRILSVFNLVLDIHVMIN